MKKKDKASFQSFAEIVLTKRNFLRQAPLCLSPSDGSGGVAQLLTHHPVVSTSERKSRYFTQRYVSTTTYLSNSTNIIEHLLLKKVGARFSNF